MPRPIAVAQRTRRWTVGAVMAAVLASLYAFVAAFAWAMEGDLGWSAWPPGEYALTGTAVLGLFIAPVALVLGWQFPFHSWRWGLWLTWPQLLLGFFLHRGCPIAPPCASVDVEPVLMPVLFIPLICLVAWLGAAARRRLDQRAPQPTVSRANSDAGELDASAQRERAEVTEKDGSIGSQSLAAPTSRAHLRSHDAPSRRRRPDVASVDPNRARIVVAVASAMLFFALQVEPRNVPLLLASAAALLYGLWLLLGARATAGRTWGVLVAAAIGGVLGFVAMIDLVWSATNDDWHGALAAYLFMAGRVWPYAVAAGLLFGFAWPEWWWRWGLILSWGFIATGVTAFHSAAFTSSSMPELFFSRAPLLLVPLPLGAAAAGAFLRGALPVAAWARAIRDSGL